MGYTRGIREILKKRLFNVEIGVRKFYENCEGSLTHYGFPHKLFFFENFFWVIWAPDPWAYTLKKLGNLCVSKKGACK